MRSKKVVKNIFSSLLLQIISVICGFIVPKLIIESYGSSVNGLISSITQFLTYIILLESGIGPVIRAALYKPIANKNKQEIASILKQSEKFFRTIAYIFIIYLIALCIIYPIFMQNQFDSLFTISLILIISISTFSEYFFGMAYRMFLQADQKTYIVSGIQILTTILNTIMIVILIKMGFSIQIVKLVSTFIFVFRPILQNLYVKKKYDINFNVADKNYKLEQKWDGLAQHVAAVVHGNTDVAILTIFSTMKEVSVYSVYLLVVNGVKNLVQSFTGGIDATFGDMIAKNEMDTLNKSFKIYEAFYFTITTIVFICTILLIVPFIGVYTKGITDVNYVRPLFGALLVIAEFIHSVRLPYSSLTLAAGHFKQTKLGAWIEAIVNIVVSIVLVINYGIIGVAIGTLIAMFIRTVEFILHTSKHILKRSVWISFFRMLVIIIEVVIVYFVNLAVFNNLTILSYMSWIIYALEIFTITTVVVTAINYFIYNEEVDYMIKKINRR